MRVGIGNRSNVAGPRRKMADTRQAKLVCQTEFGVTTARSHFPLVKTDGFNACIVLSLTSSSNMTGGLAHFDPRTMVQPSLTEVVLPEFRRRGCRDLQAQIIGAVPDEASLELARKIRDVLVRNNVKIAGVDVDSSGPNIGLILDTTSMEIFDIEPPLLPDDEINSRHRERALMYIARNPAKRLIRLV